MQRHTDELASAIVRAGRIAKKMGHLYVGTEHIVLAILADDENIPCAGLALYNLGVTTQNFDAEVRNILGM